MDMLLVSIPWESCTPYLVLRGNLELCPEHMYCLYNESLGYDGWLRSRDCSWKGQGFEEKSPHNRQKSKERTSQRTSLGLVMEMPGGTLYGPGWSRTTSYDQGKFLCTVWRTERMGVRILRVNELLNEECGARKSNFSAVPNQGLTQADAPGHSFRSYFWFLRTTQSLSELKSHHGEGSCAHYIMPGCGATGGNSCQEKERQFSLRVEVLASLLHAHSTIVGWYKHLLED